MDGNAAAYAVYPLGFGAFQRLLLPLPRMCAKKGGSPPQLSAGKQSARHPTIKAFTAENCRQRVWQLTVKLIGK